MCPNTGATSRSQYNATAMTTNVSANPAARDVRARPDAACEREDRCTRRRPAEQVVQERERWKQPRVLLVHEEREPDDEEAPPSPAPRRLW
jgi:hypothetical protein